MKIIINTILVLFVFLFDNNYSFRDNLNVIPASDCRIKFNDVGIKDFKFGISKEEVIDKFSDKERVNQNITSVENYLCRENTKIMNSSINIEYGFSFKNNKLRSYLFQFEGDLVFFNELIDLTKRNGYNDFINENSIDSKYLYIKKDKYCSKFFKIIKRNGKLIITGGISQIE